MADQWYYLVNGKRYGPVTQKRLEELRGMGVLGLDSEAWQEDPADDVPAGSAKENQSKQLVWASVCLLLVMVLPWPFYFMVRMQQNRQLKKAASSQPVLVVGEVSNPLSVAEVVRDSSRLKSQRVICAGVIRERIHDSSITIEPLEASGRHTPKLQCLFRILNRHCVVGDGVVVEGVVTDWRNSATYKEFNSRGDLSDDDRSWIENYGVLTDCEVQLVNGRS